MATIKEFVETVEKTADQHYGAIHFLREWRKDMAGDDWGLVTSREVDRNFILEFCYEVGAYYWYFIDSVSQLPNFDRVYKNLSCGGHDFLKAIHEVATQRFQIQVNLTEIDRPLTPCETTLVIFLGKVPHSEYN